MVYAKQNEAFIKNKNQFFTQLRTHHNPNISSKLAETDKLVGTADYRFLLQNQLSLETEFTQMFAVLRKQKKQNNEAFWLYCYYSASMLEAFYKTYAQDAKEQQYQDLKQQIKKRLLQVTQEKAAEERFIDSLQNSFLQSFRNLAKIPFHLSVLRDYVAYTNLCRLYWVFSRLTISNGLLFAKALEFIDKIDAVLGTHTDVNKIISVFQAPNGVLNYFSVGLFLARFVIDAGLLIRHTFFPTATEKASQATAYERFKYELYKRHCNFTNDLVWATVNFLTNFNHLTNIPGPVAGAITAVFLGFDVSMMLYKLHLARQEYLVKKAQYLQEIKQYTQVMGLTAEERAQHLAMLHQQLGELEINWQTKEATFYFAAAAAAMLMLGFSAALILSPPGLILASFFVCHLGIAMYFSTGAYGKYTEKSLYLRQAELNNDDLVVARKEFELARNDFIFSMVKNTTLPLVLITTFAICWPAAVVLTAVYLGYELAHAFDQHEGNKEAKQLALAADADEVGNCGMALG